MAYIFIYIYTYTYKHTKRIINVYDSFMHAILLLKKKNFNMHRNAYSTIREIFWYHCFFSRRRYKKKAFRFFHLCVLRHNIFLHFCSTILSHSSIDPLTLHYHIGESTYRTREFKLFDFSVLLQYNYNQFYKIIDQITHTFTWITAELLILYMNKKWANK